LLYPKTHIAHHRAKIAAIILAAGESARMGRQKLLLPLAGTSIIRRVVERVSASSVDELIVVVNPDGGELRDELSGSRCSFVANEHYRDGMGTSFHAAAASLDDEVAAALFVLADQPFITAAMLDELLSTYRRCHPLAVVSRFGGVIAPPYLFAREVFPGLGVSGKDGAKALLQKCRERCVVIDLPEKGLLDVDDAASYQAAVQLAARKSSARRNPAPRADSAAR
jgi:molybdenum cofactor cytidylyltransferase